MTRTVSSRSRMHGVRPARRVAAALAALLASALLASCAIAPVDSDIPLVEPIAEGAGWPADAPIAQPADMTTPVAWWGDASARDTVTFITFGSSSCPYSALGIESLADDRLRVVFLSEADGPCTEDLAPAFHTLPAPDGLGTGRVTADVELRVAFDGTSTPSGEFSIMIFDPTSPAEGGAEPTEPGSDTGVPASIAGDEYAGLPRLLPGPTPGVETPDGPQAYWLSPVQEVAGERELTIVTYGSSTCPLIPTALDPGVGEGVIGVTLRERATADAFCTLDLAPFTSVLAVPLEAAAGATTVAFTTLARVGEPRQQTVDIIDLAG